MTSYRVQNISGENISSFLCTSASCIFTKDSEFTKSRPIVKSNIDYSLYCPSLHGHFRTDLKFIFQAALPVQRRQAAAGSLSMHIRSALVCASIHHRSRHRRSFQMQPLRRGLGALFVAAPFSKTAATGGWDIAGEPACAFCGLIQLALGRRADHRGGAGGKPCYIGCVFPVARLNAIARYAT